MASNPFDKFDEEPAAEGGNPFDKFDSEKPKTQRGEWETFSVPARPRQFVSPEDRPARMVNQQRGTRQVPVEGPGGRAIYEAGGRTTDFLTARGATPEVAAAGGYAVNLGGQIASTFAGGGIGRTAEPAVQGAGKFLMRNAMGPTKTQVTSGVADRAAEATLKEGISVSKGGREAAQLKIDAIKNTLDDLASRAQGTVSVIDVLNPISKKIKELESAKGGLDFEEKISKIRTEIAKLLDNPDFRGKSRVPVPVANDMKRSIYGEIGDPAYKAGIKSGSEKAAKSDVAQSLKEQVEKFVPEAKNLNRNMGDLIEARKLIDSRLGKQAGAAPISPFSLLMAVHNPTLAALHFAERNPQTSSTLARLLYSGKIPTEIGRVAGAGVGAYSGSSDK